MSRTICEGLQVVEMGAGSVAGALAGMFLADNGARVVKLEPPEGDRLRTLSPSGFLVWNRGKESVVADLRTKAGQAAARDLIARADVVIEGFGTGVADAWGLGADAVRAVNPALVYCSIKGFGSSGPYAHLPAYEGVVAAKAGSFNMGVYGFRDGPIFFSALLASTGAGHMACAGILAALIARETTGRGQLVEANMKQGLDPLDYFGTMTYQNAMRAPAGSAKTTDPIAMLAASRYSFFVPTQDGRWVIFTQMLPHQAKALSRACGMEWTLDDERYAKQPQFPTAEDAQGWEDLLWEAMSQQPYEHWERIFLADPDIAFELARFSEEGLDHQQIRHNGEAITITDPVVGPVEQVGPVANFRATPARIERSAPALGAHDGPLTGPSVPAAAGGAAPAHPLSGKTIVELGYFYAMPMGITMAGGLGARVIKIEGRTGDPMRMSFGAPEVGGAKTMEGKESLAVDLSTDEGRAIVRQIAVTADVFVNGFRPGALEKMGLGPDDLLAANPRLQYIHAAGYGHDGPLSYRPIYAQVAQAVAGSIGRYAGKWLDPEMTRTFSWFEAQVVSLPRLRGITDGDSNAALAVLTTTLLALYDQQRTGQGQLISTTMIGGNALSYIDDFNRYAGKPPMLLADEENHGQSALYRLYPAAEGWVFLAGVTEKERAAFAAAIGRAEPLPAWADPADTAPLVVELAGVFATRTAQEWEDLLVPLGVPCVRVTDVAVSQFTSTDPGLREMGLTTEVVHPHFGPIVRHAPVAKFSDMNGRVEPGCLNGQHTEAILAELGYDDDAIAGLKARQVVFGRAELTA
jgi:crotonobetainyl-CoA:carnitine CoA-transferase CaiB-like acyl-CoA transferase